MPKLSWSRSTRRALLASALLGSSAVVIGAVPAHADGGAMTAVDGVFTGTSGNDTLVIGSNFMQLTNNRYDMGDPGFESPLDFDSTVPGVQTKTAGNAVSQFSFNGGDGDDTLKITSGVGHDSVDTLDMGAGSDTVDATLMSTGIRLGVNPNNHMETVEKVLGSLYPDAIYGYAGGAARALPFSVFAGGGSDIVQGTDGPDRLDGGGKDNQISGLGGDDVIYASYPLPTAERAVDGGPGNDALVVTGTAAGDLIDLVGAPGNFWAFDDNNFAGGYHAVGIERAQLNLLDGNDSAYVSTVLPMAVVTGGPGTDEVILDALGSTAAVDTSTAIKKISIPLAYGNGATNPLTVKLDSQVEHLYLANETTIGTAPASGSPRVRTFRADGTPLADFYAYDPNFGGGVNLALGDVNGDGDGDIVTAPGAGGGPQVRAFYSDGTDTGLSFMAYDAGFTGGVNVATADVDGNGVDENVTAPASAGGAHVRIWSGSGQLLHEWMASGFGSGGVHVARGPWGANGETIIVSSAAGDSTVRTFNADGSVAAMFPSYSPYPGFGGGAAVSRGLFANSASGYTSDNYDETVTGAGPGGGPLVRIVERRSDGQGVNTIGAFFAYSQTFAGGVDVATCNADGGPDEILTAPGRGAMPLIRTFSSNGSIKRKSFLAYDSSFTGGVHVACGATMSRAYGV